MALYRASDIPCRYVYGVVRIPIEKVKNWVGIEDSKTALNALSSGGIPTKGLIVGGELKYAELEHVWVEAYIPLTHYRGASVDESGKAWVPLDPSFKQYHEVEGTDIEEEIPFDAEGLIDELESRASIGDGGYSVSSIDQEYIKAQLEEYQETLTSYLEENHEGDRLGDILGARKIAQENYAILPLSLPYEVKSIQQELSTLNNSFRQQLTLEITDKYNINSASYTASIPELADKRISISYTAASEEDVELIASYLPEEPVEGEEIDPEDLPDSLPAYLIEVKPQIMVNGEVKTEGTNEQYDQIQPASISGDLLHSLGLSYFAQVDMFNQLLERKSGVKSTRITSAGITAVDLDIGYTFGRPKTASAGGLYIDVDRNSHTIQGLDGDTEKVKAYNMVTGQISSYLEGGLFQQAFGGEAVSTMHILQKDNEDGIKIYQINEENTDNIIPQLDYDSTKKQQFRDLIDSGKKITVPEREVSIGGWTGTGYIASNPDGTAAYMIDGGLTGGYWPFSDWETFIISVFLTIPFFFWGGGLIYFVGLLFSISAIVCTIVDDVSLYLENQCTFLELIALLGADMGGEICAYYIALIALLPLIPGAAVPGVGILVVLLIFSALFTYIHDIIRDNIEHVWLYKRNALTC